MHKCVAGQAGPSTDEISQQIKDQITIPVLAEKLFPGWEPKKLGPAPHREDRKPSFSVYKDGKRFKDFATDERGDVFDFYRLATGSDQKAAFKALKEMIFGHSAPSPIIRAPAPVRPEEERQRVHPDLRKPSPEELRVIADLRTIDVAALQLAVDRGFLWTAKSNVYHCEAWIVTDKTRRNYRARRLDGQKWPNGAKSVAPTGAESSWPIGITEAQYYPCIALCEGEGDFLAAFGHMLASGTEARVAPVCMSGASNRIPAEAIPLFGGKRVRIFVQADRAGENAYFNWGGQLHGIAAAISGFKFTGYYDTNESVVTDLNDLLRIHPDNLEANRKEIDSIMQF